eukprot:SAG31_NODE_23506_length_503_cov_0.626238_2_plen_41_part_01
MRELAADAALLDRPAAEAGRFLTCTLDDRWRVWVAVEAEDG